jgi:hypothetical protein
MAEVPYSGVPTQSPDLQAPDDLQHIEASPASFGSQVGESLEQAGGKLLDLSRFYGQVAADHATNNFLEQSRALIYGDPSKGVATGPDGQPVTSPSGSAAYNGGFYGLRGQDALNAYPEVRQQLTDMLAEQREGLTTARARLQFDNQSRRYLSQTLGEMGAHADQQRKVWADQTATNTIALNQNAVAGDLNNPAALAQDREDLRHAVAKQDQTKFGFDSPEIQEGAKLRADQIFYTTQVKVALGNNDPDRAKQALDESGSILASSPEYDALTRAVRTAVFEKTSVTLSDTATQDALAQAAAQSKASGLAAPPPGAPVPAPTGPIYDQIGKSAAAHGATLAETGFLQREAQIESSGNPAAQNGQSTGLFQFHPSTFAGLGGIDIHDTDQQTAAALRGARQNTQLLNEAGVPVTDGNLYLMHQQGPAGGRALLTAPPDTNAIQALAPAYGGNVATATRAIVNNGGTPDMTAGQFTSLWQTKFGGGGGGGSAATSSIADNLLMNKAALVAQFRTKAEASMPNDPYHQDLAVQRFERSLDQTISQQEDQYRADTNLVIEASEGATSFADIRARGAQASAALDRLSIENPMAYNSLEHRFDVDSKGKAETFGTNFSDYLSRALAPTTDPNRITNPMQLNAFLGAGKDAALTTAGQKALADLTAIRGTPQGEAFVSQARTILGQMHGDLTFSSQPAGRFDPKGEAKFSEFSAVALPILVNAYKTGTIVKVLDPKSPDYLGNLAQHFMRTPAEITKDHLDYSARDIKRAEREDPITRGKNLLADAVKRGRMSQAEAIRVGEDLGYFAPSRPATPAVGWKIGQPPPVSALPPLGG